MQELRLVGVHEDGEHLLLSGQGSETFTLPIDEALRMAASEPLRRRSGARNSNDPSLSMTPREIQSRIRAGATANEVAAESGLDMAHILRYEGPVRAERDYLAAQARKVEVSGPLPSHEGYRSAFGNNPATLGDMVTHRLSELGIRADDVEWDAWRGQEGRWEVVAHFDLPDAPRTDVGENPPARWSFNPARKTISNANRWAQVLSEMEPLDGPLPQRRLSAVADHPFDFEAVNSATGEASTMEQHNDSEDLLDTLRSRRGQRLGADEDGDDALALMLTKGNMPAARPRDGVGSGENHRAGHTVGADNNLSSSNVRDDADGSADVGGAEQNEPTTNKRSRFGSLSLAPHIRGNKGLPKEHGNVDNQTRQVAVPVTASSSIQKPVTRAADSQDADGKQSDSPDRKPGKPKRSSVPSWDDIVFGTKGD